MADGRLPLTILGGFLGAGKSSWARHQLYEGQYSRHHVIVNEAAGTPVDNLLLGAATRLTVLAGGCACCDGLASLIAALVTICDEASGTAAGQINGILLETSGIADPGAIASAIAADQILSRRIRVAGVLVLVDALHGLDQLRNEPLARAQIEAADQLIIAKSAAARDEDTACLIATLRLLAPDAGISGAELGMEYALPPPGKARAMPDLAQAPPIHTFRLDIGGEGSWVGLSVWLSALLQARGGDVIRVKGVVRSPAGRLLLQSVRSVVQPPEILPDSLVGPALQDGVIVLIGRNIDEEMLTRSWAVFGA